MIKNIIFDIGNVLVKWDPIGIVTTAFPEHQDLPTLAQQIFKSEIWLDLNKGKITEIEAIQRYHSAFDIELNRLQLMIQIAKESLTPIEGGFQLLESAHQAGYFIYGLSDNTHDIMKYLREKYHYWHLFKNIVISAEVGYLKPSPEIYNHLLNQFQLNAHESVFIDDLTKNIEGAKALNIHGIVFQNIKQCIQDLNQLNIYL